MAEVVDLKTGVVGDGVVIDVDQVIEQAKGQFLRVVVIGWDKHRQFQIRSSHGSREAMWILNKGIDHLLNETE